MPLTLAVALVLGQMSSADLKALRKYRYGLSAAQIESMGQDAYERVFASQTPDHDAGVYRGVAYGVYIDAYRENTGRRYRAASPPDVRSRLLAVDKQMRLIGVLFARNDWLFTGGNAFDPEADDLAYAKAERRLYTTRSGQPNPGLARRTLAGYDAAIRKRLAKEEPTGTASPAEGRRAIMANLGKIDRAVTRTIGLCRTLAERSVVLDFVAQQARAAMSEGATS